MLDIPVLVDEQARGRELLERLDVQLRRGIAHAVGALADALEGGRHVRRVGKLRQAHRRAGRARARAEQAVLLVDRLE